MKNLIYLLLVFTFISCKKEIPSFKKTQLKASKIDSLNSVASIENFIISNDSTLKGYKLKRIQDFEVTYNAEKTGVMIADSLNIQKSYYKADFDNNGYQDLLVIGDFYSNNLMYPFVFLNYGKDSIKTINAKVNRHAFVVPKISIINREPFLEIYSADYVNYDIEKVKKRKEKLTFKYDNFIEYNPNPEIHDIERIEFSTTGCYGTCPVFDIDINSDKTAVFKPHYFNFSQDNNAKEEKGILKTKLKEKDFSEIIELLNYIDFPQLKNDYSVSWTDDQSCTLKITFDNGKVKTIKDYGLVGTYGLNRFYNMLFDLRKNQKWK